MLNNRLVFVGIALGALTGFSYYFFVGCKSGSCAITSSAMNSTLYGMLCGYAVFSMIPDKKKKNDA